ncbi:peptide deformylase [Sagittula sp. M10.9X]|uniref:Peptide deformylase n=1 Tax=Sagittula salina TaxID=2820268 RepID=A0A940MVL0_9RHOB|nr:peptide deformylase [Sagittula salina]
MEVMPILRWPDPRLATPCTPVEDTKAVAELVERMFATMYDAPGRGLAAPQVGVTQRLFVMDAGWKTGPKTPVVCINPVAEPLGAVDEGVEACLSMPGVEVTVPRPSRVRLRYTDLTGEEQVVALEGAEARIAQHETDHLDGRMHFDNVAPETRAAILAAWETA